MTRIYIYTYVRTYTYTDYTSKRGWNVSNGGSSQICKQQTPSQRHLYQEHLLEFTADLFQQDMMKATLLILLLCASLCACVYEEAEGLQ